ncbi:MAG: hypothetical protein ABSE46_18730 [Terracidiphilus sp.]|jgi:hypothetical protein
MASFLGRAWPGAVALAGGAVLRVWMLKAIPQVSGDTLIYGGLAKNLLLHGQYAITDGSGVLHSTLIRLPGYPLFLAACFKLFGMENYDAVAYVQIAMELAGCLLLAGFAGEIAPAGVKPDRVKRGAALATLWLAAICPFTASYAVAPLTETPTLFAIALALWALARFRARPGWGYALLFTFAVCFAAMLRPDGALVGVALAPGLVWGAWTRPVVWFRLARMAPVCLLLAMIPFGVWTARNWRTFHVIEPLAPRYATDPGEDIYPGWQRWVKTWCLDFVSTYDIYWNLPGSPFDLNKLPARAFDSPAQYAETEALKKAYDDNGQDFSQSIDDGFARLAEERVKADPLRYYIGLPLGRMADMWLRPRVENLNIDLDWWVYAHHNSETRFSWEYAGLNAMYLLLGVVGLCLRPKFWPWMLAYLVMRSALLMTIEAPEARYTLECFPMVFALGGIAVAAGLRRATEGLGAKGLRNRD